MYYMTARSNAIVDLIISICMMIPVGLQASYGSVAGAVTWAFMSSFWAATAGAYYVKHLHLKANK
jgi:hypothetical protein